MSEYNMNKLNNPDPIQNESGHTPTPEQNKPRYGMAILVGIGTAVIVAILLAMYGIAEEEENVYLVICGVALVGIVIKFFIPGFSGVGALIRVLIGAILCAGTYGLYQYILAMYGYYYTEDGEGTFWSLLIGCAIFGAFMCRSTTDD